MTTQVTVGIRELKARLDSYVRQVESGTTLVITDQGKLIGRVVPMGPSIESRMLELTEAGLIAWNGRKLVTAVPTVRLSGERTVAELLLEDRA